MASDAKLGEVERNLWSASDKLRGSLHPGEYQHVVLSLVLLRYIGLEGRQRGFRVPAMARWESVADPGDQGTAAAVAAAVACLEAGNPEFVGLLPHEWTDGRIDDRRLRDLVDLLTEIPLVHRRGDDLFGAIYEFFLQRFAASDKKGSGEFYTPQCVVELLVEMLEPLAGRIYDPCCGAGGMFVRSLSFVRAHGKDEETVSVFGQESNATTWKLAKMNLLVRRIGFDLGPHAADTLHHDLHTDLKADYILANPPFNMSAWGGDELRGDSRWIHGDPPEANANFAWVQHILDHLAPEGRAAIVLANGALTATKDPEATIRKGLVDSGFVECIVGLPSKLFYSTQIPASIWVVSKAAHKRKANSILFIDASRSGELISRSQRHLVPAERSRIADAFKRWGKKPNQFRGERGFSAAINREEVAAAGYVLSPPRYVGLDDDELEHEGDVQQLKEEILGMIESGKKLDADVLKALANVET